MAKTKIWRRAFDLGTGVFVICGILASIHLRPSDPAGRPVTSMLNPDDPAVVALGREIYAGHCAACHGENGEGREIPSETAAGGTVTAPPHDGSGHTWQHADSVLFELTKYGSSDVVCFTPSEGEMPDFQSSLKDDEIVAVLSFIKSQWPAEIRRKHDAINALYSSAE